MGVVYLAEDTRLGRRQVAIKELSLNQVPSADRTWQVDAFRREAQLLASLHHPGLAGVSDFFQAGDRLYLVMEYVQGQTLDAHCASYPGKRLPVDEALNIVQQLAAVLDYLHKHTPPIIFRDLKPGNIMISSNGQVKLIDFGIARLFKPGQHKDTQHLGTPGYAAPEQYGRGQTDARSDVYSLGVLLHELLTGYDPALTPMNLPPPRQLDPTMAPHLAAAIDQAIQIEPGRRFASAGAFYRALTSPRTTTAAEAVAPARPPRWLFLAGGALLLFLLGGGAFILLGDDRPAPTAVADVLPEAVATTTLAAPTAERSEAEVPIAAETRHATATTPATTPTVPPTVTAAPRQTPTPPGAEQAPLPGSGVVRLTSAGSDEYVPVLAPDQRTLVFMSNRAGNWQLFRTDATRLDGGWQLLTDNSADNYHAHFAPDGSRLVFASKISGDWELYTMAPDGSNWQQITQRSGDDVYPSFSPDGQWIVYMSQRNNGWGIYRIRADGYDDRLVYDSTAGDSFPFWAPDGTTIAFQSGQDGNEEIYTIPWTGGTPTRLTYDGGRDANPVYAPDGRWLAFESNRDGNYNIYAVRPDGSGLRQLTADSASDQIPFFSPDGLWLLFQSQRDGNWELYRQPFDS
jgi:Tol biopolymer transport system component